jgi:hypothetical protein
VNIYLMTDAIYDLIQPQPFLHQDCMAASTIHRLDCRAIGRRTLAQVGLRSYGYSWWLLSAEEGNFLALGKDVQYLYINPARE